MASSIGTKKGKSMAKKAAKSTRSTKITAPTTQVVASAKSENREKIENSNVIKKRLTRKNIVILLSLIFIGALLYYFRSLFIVATVNGEPINRVAFTKELEKQSGKQTLNTLVTKTLITQEAEKQNVTATQEEIDQELKKVEASLKDSGQSLDQALQMQGLTREGFQDQLRYQKLIEKMVGKNIIVSDAEINKYLEDNKESVPETTEASEAAALRVSIKDQLTQQKLSEKVQEWLANLQKNAKINYFLNL